MKKCIMKQAFLSVIPILLLMFFSLFIHYCVSGIHVLYDFYFTYFLVPFIVLLIIYFLYKGIVKIRILYKNDIHSINKTVDLFELQTKFSKNISYFFSWIIAFALICIIVFSIIGVYSVPETVEQASTLFTVEQLTDSSYSTGTVDYQRAISLFKQSVFIKREYYQGHSIAIRQEILTSCSKGFIDTYYQSNCKGEISSYHQNSGRIQEFSTANGYGQLFVSDSENEIHIVMRNESSMVTLVVFVYPTEQFKVLSTDYAIELCDQFLSREDRGANKNTGNAS